MYKTLQAVPGNTCYKYEGYTFLPQMTMLITTITTTITAVVVVKIRQNSIEKVGTIQPHYKDLE